MGNGYNHHHQNLQLHHKATFLPILCSRPSLKDVALPSLQDNSTTPLSTDPLSPKIGCMGQVKRHNNKIAGYPTPNKITLSSSHINSASLINYSKLRRIFSAKNIPTNPISHFTVSRPKGSMMIFSSARRREKSTEDHRRNNRNNSVSVIRIEEMDPPLPVIKKVHKQAEEVDTIWKRRSGGLALKNLQLHQIQLNRLNFAPTTV